MADRMRVTSLIGGTGWPENVSGTFSASSSDGFRNPGLFDESNPLTPRTHFAIEENVHESTSRLAKSPVLLRHAYCDANLVQQPRVGRGGNLTNPSLSSATSTTHVCQRRSV